MSKSATPTLPSGLDHLAPARDLDHIDVKGAREHNLQNVNLRIPRKKLVVFTGPSGSGKSSLAFDTLFAEGQRRYVESLSAYARQFLGQMEKPKVDAIRGLSPTISIEQKSGGTNPRSTVGTITEILDHLRVMYARLGDQQCHNCGKPVGGTSSDEIVRQILSLEDGKRFMLLAPVARNRKGEYKDIFAGFLADGFTRVLVDGETLTLEPGLKLDKNKRHNIDVIVDRLVARADARERIADSVELALRVGEGVCGIQVVDGGAQTFSIHNACEDCGLAFPELSPQSFSFNSPVGMCPCCNGLGEEASMDPDLIVPDQELSLNDGAVVPWKQGDSTTWTWEIIRGVCTKFRIDEDKPWKKLTERQRTVLMYGSDKEISVEWKRKRSQGTWTTTFEGVANTLMRRYRETTSAKQRDLYAAFLSTRACSECGGGRLRKESNAVLVGGRRLVEVCTDTIQDALDWIERLELLGNKATIGKDLVREIAGRLQFLVNVGLEYLSLNRPGPTLSGGEMQRIRLASQLGSELSGVLYVLDEPSIGLHARDNQRLLATLERLRDMGNSVVVVEHDAETMENADWVVDFGPGAGRKGGEIVFSGTCEDMKADPNSLTGQYLSGRRTIPVPGSRRKGTGKKLKITNAHANNLKNLNVVFELGTFTCVTGVSGAGKSTLVNQILVPMASRKLFRNSTAVAGAHDRVQGLGYIDKVIEIDQKPIGRTPRSNPATYVKVFDDIRAAFANLPEARMYGYDKGRFSFNVAGGRCEACQGGGQKKIEMHFLADVYVPCEVCQGRRFNDATLKVRYKGHSINEILNLSVDDALELFTAVPRIHRILGTLADVGLGYIHLGQPSPTLSGGEAQRVKLSRELAKVATGRTLYVLDEPSTGLHFEDIRKLLAVVDRLVDAGNTVVMIEHNLDIIKTADRVLDLGPEGGRKGGHIVAAGTPEQVAKVPSSWTGVALAPLLS
mgnify:CR=1 FL=1